MARTRLRRSTWAIALLLLTGCGSCGSCEEEEDQAIRLSEDAGPRVVEILLAQPPEEGDTTSLLTSPAPQLSQVIRNLVEVAERDRIRGLFLRLGPLGGAWGRSGDLIQALERVREAGKPVHCHFDAGDNVTILLAAKVCDRVSVTPAGIVDLVGPSAHVFYAKNLLDRIGVRAQLVQMGRYKGAADPFTREEMPETTRESLGAILDGLHGALVTALTEHRDMPRERAVALIDGGPHTAHDARQANLVDDVAFDDEAREHARQAAEAPDVQRVSLLPKSEPMGLGDLLSALTGRTPSEPAVGERVGLVTIAGTIVDAERKGMSGVRSGPLVRALRKMADDDLVEAVVLRIQSPGGSALASDRIWHAVRRVAKRKPVIASISDMAASGGYYIASAATHILAHDESLVGSIGVVGGKVVLSELAKNVGLNVVVLQRGRNAAWMSPFQPMTDEDRGVLEGLLRSTYRRFMKRVATGRDLPMEKVRAAAEGRLMTGARARELGLVDEAGGLERAIDLAREKSGLPPDSPVERWPEHKTLLEAIAESFGGGGGDGGSVRHLLSQAGSLAGPLAEVALLPEMIGRERVALTLPFVVRIQ
ncbi:MAG: signal peptide peptidase SppA [Myxococcota bacterium]